MAGVPCVNSRCSTEPTVDANGRLNIDVRIDGDGGLTCTEGQGLGVLLNPDASNILSLSTSGLLASREGYQISQANGTAQAWTANNMPTGNSVSINVNNSSVTNDRLLVVLSKWQWNVTITGDEWSADGAFYTEIGGDTVSQAFSIGGADATPAASASDDKIIASHAAHAYALPANSSVIVRSYGSGLTTNAGSFNNSQFRAFLQLLVVDMPPAALFSVT